jgi:hypothetical protein
LVDVLTCTFRNMEDRQQKDSLHSLDQSFETNGFQTTNAGSFYLFFLYLLQ